MAIFMLLLAAVMVVPHAYASEDDTTTVTTTSESGDDDGTADQGSGDSGSNESDDNETETEDESEDEAEDAEDESDDSETEGDDDGTADQGSGDNEVSSDIAVTAAAVSANAEVEAEAMDTTLGAQIRLLELERQIQRSILHMEAVVSVINDSNQTNVTGSVSALNSIVAEMKQLKDEAADAAESAENKDEALKVFLEIKAEAKALVGEFRETARPLLTETEVRALREEFGGIDKDSLKAIDDKIKQLKRNRDAARLQAFLTAASLENDALVAQVRSGEVSLSDARKWIKEQLDGLDDDELKEARKKLEEKRIRERVEARDRALKQREELLSRLEIRAGERARELERLGFEERRERMETRTKILDEKGRVLEERRERVETRVRENINGETIRTRTETRTETRERSESVS